MRHRLSWIVTAAMLLGTTAATQSNCPKSKAITIPRNVEFHGMAKCGSVTLNVGGATFSGPAQGCPLLAVLVPEHELETEQTNGERTQARVYEQVTTWIYHYACERDWMLFIPWGSSCRLATRKAGAALPRMTTVPCTLIEPVPQHP